MTPMTRFTLDQLQYAISSLANLLRAGVITSEALRELQQLQPRHADFWGKAAEKAAKGDSLSSTMRPILDDAMYAAINAAELSGTLSVVFARLEKAMDEQRDIRRTLRTMYYPFAMLFGAVAVFTLYLAFVVPSLASAMPSKSKSPSTLNIVANALHDFLMAYYIHLGVATVAAVVFTVMWLRNPENRTTLISVFDRFPMLGSATRDLYYGEWATHMSINTHAGITVIDAIKLTYVMLPAFYHPEILAVSKDITRVGQANAAAARGTNDPRNNLPFLIVNAFRFSEKTGVADVNFQFAADALITQGKKRIELFVKTATNILTPVTAILGASAILPYFMQVGSSFSNMH